MKRLLVVLLLLSPFVKLAAQEVLTDFDNIRLTKYSSEYFQKHNSKNTMEVDTLELPFFDDFANSFVYPDSTLWLDKFAFINNDYAKSPISYGIATLDAINQYGAVYTHLPSISSAIADFFTSRPINLNVLAEDSVYLSFYYQAGGYGNVPEERDSLVLQFKTPLSEWESVWNVAGGESMDVFENVMIPIVDEDYLVKGFQFRFLNYASVSSAYEPSWVSNTDHWNLDYIKLDTARNYFDTLNNEAAFVKNFSSMVDSFECIPWKHFLTNPEELMKDSLVYVFNNTTLNTTLNVIRQCQVFDLSDNSLEYFEDNDNDNIDPLSTLEYKQLMDYVFDSEAEDSVTFLIKGFLGTDLVSERNIYRWNDTIHYYQNFKNYYAYDDGTAEKGYGITGQNTAYASLAYQFTPITADTLYGVYIYFNQVMNEGNRKYFFLNVWGDNNGIPGDTLFQKIGVIPEYSDEVNEFLYYSLDTALYIDTTFYVGWTKTTDDMLNCGFDLNRVSNQHLFYNVTGEWVNSQIEGALMVRPVFGIKPVQSFVPEIVANEKFEIYPNPAYDIINISTDSEFDQVQIFDATGKLIISTINEDEINVGSLQNGIYFVKLMSEFNSFKTQKLIISR
jgi:hypothetical protein